MPNRRTSLGEERQIAEGLSALSSQTRNANANGTITDTSPPRQKNTVEPKRKSMRTIRPTVSSDLEIYSIIASHAEAINEHAGMDVVKPSEVMTNFLRNFDADLAPLLRKYLNQKS